MGLDETAQRKTDQPKGKNEQKTEKAEIRLQKQIKKQASINILIKKDDYIEQLKHVEQGASLKLSTYKENGFFLG